MSDEIILSDFILREYALGIENIMREENAKRHYGIEVNFLDLLNENTDFALMIIRNPIAYQSLLYTCIQSVQNKLLSNSLYPGISLKPHVHLRWSGIPCSEETFFNRIPGMEVQNRLISLRGTVTKVGGLKMMDSKCVYRCSKCKSETISYPDDRQFGIVPKPLMCEAIVDYSRCGSTKFDISNDQKYDKHDYQEIKIQENTSLLEVGAVPRSLTVILRHELVDTCKAGDEIICAGWVLSRWKLSKTKLRCETEFCMVSNNVITCNARAPSHENKGKEFADKFWVGHRDDPLRGRNLLIASFCPRIFGLHLVKLAVLLTIVGGCGESDGGGDGGKGGTGGARKHRKEGHLLLVGDPGTAKSQFLVTAAKLSTRSVVTTGSGSTNAGLTVAASKETGEWQLEAGALVLADGGICCIDEFNNLRQHDRTAIHEAMEQQTLSVAKAGLVCKLQARCSIIAACNSKGNFDEGETISSNVAIASPLLSRFDLILVMVDRKSEEWDRRLSQLILESVCKSNPTRRSKENAINFDTLKQYINLVRNEKNPVMSVGSRIVLGKYYEVQRRADLRDVARTTLRLLESLIRLSQAHAKLMYRDKVLLSDAVWAIILMETSLPTQSLCGIKPDVYAEEPSNPTEEYLKYEESILKRLEINKEIAESAGRFEFDDSDAEEILSSWTPTQHY